MVQTAIDSCWTWQFFIEIMEFFGDHILFAQRETIFLSNWYLQFFLIQVWDCIHPAVRFGLISCDFRSINIDFHEHYFLESVVTYMLLGFSFLTCIQLILNQFTLSFWVLNFMFGQQVATTSLKYFSSSNRSGITMKPCCLLAINITVCHGMDDKQWYVFWRIR